MPYRPIYQDFEGVLACSAPAWRRCGARKRSAHQLEQRHQAALPARVAVDIALRDLYRLVTGQQLHVAQAAAGLVRVSAP